MWSMEYASSLMEKFWPSVKAGGILAPGSANAFQNAVYQASCKGSHKGTKVVFDQSRMQTMQVERSLNDAKKPGPQPTDLGLLERPFAQLG